MPRRALLVDDDRSMCEVVATHLRSVGFDVSWFTSGQEALFAVEAQEFDVALVDLKMPGMGGLELCERIASSTSEIPVVVITAFGSVETAVEAMRAGAHDFVTKPIELELLSLTLERAVEHRILRAEVRKLSAVVEKAERFDQLIGSSPPMRRLYSQLERIADSDTSVLIAGESGTGKELVARALHRKSPRSAGPFVAVNCGALPDALVESELFGHVRGAFTGAGTAHRGMFIEASGGTLLLDEIGELPLSLQPKLLRVLEAGSVRPVGGEREVACDARILASTNRDLESAVEEGRFREDLFFRINVIQVELPSLRARGTDILLLARHFLEQCAAHSHKQVSDISDAAAEKLLGYKWPGNVRELRNAIARAVALTRVEEISVEDLPEKIRAYRGSHVVIGAEDPGELATLEEVERRYILHVLEAVGGNRTRAARVLGLDRKTLYRKLLKYGVAGITR